MSSYLEGFKAARKAASEIVIGYTDGDSPFDGTIARMAEEIDRLVPEVTERHAASPAPTECVALLPSRNPLREGCPMHSCRDAGACCFPGNCDTSRPAIGKKS